MGAFYNSTVYKEQIVLKYTVAGEEKYLEINAPVIESKNPITSTMLQGFFSQVTGAQLATGYYWQDDYYRKNTFLGGSYIATNIYTNPNLDETERQNLASYRSLLTELEGLVESGTGNNIMELNGNDESTWFYNRSDPSISGADSSQELHYENGVGTLHLTFYIDRPMPGQEFVYNSGIKIVAPLGSGQQSYIQGDNMTGTWQSSGGVNENAPRIGYWVVTVDHNNESIDQDHYEEKEKCLLIIIRNYANNENYYKSTLFSLSMLDSVEKSEDPKTDDDAQTVTPNAWVGDWSYSPDEDSVAPITGHNFFNAWEHGPRLYIANSAKVDALMQCAWDLSFRDASKLAIQAVFLKENVDFIKGILSIHQLPFTSTPGTARDLTICGYNLSKYMMGINPEITSWTPVSQQTIQLTSNDLYIGAHYSDDENCVVFMDYDGVKAEVRLPFIGKVPIDIKAFRGKYLSVNYNIDLSNGNCVAQIYCKNNESDRKVLMYQGSGNCSIPVPFSGNTQGAFKQLGTISGIAGGLVSSIGGFVQQSPGAMISGISAISSTLAGSGSNTTDYNYVHADASGMYDPFVKLVISGDIPVIPPKMRNLIGYKAFGSGTVENYITNPDKTKQDGIVVGTVHAGIDRATDAERREIESLFERGVIV